MIITKDQIKAHGLKEEEYKKITGLLGREANLVELGIFSAMWNEHCSYKSSKIHLKKLPTKNNIVIQVFIYVYMYIHIYVYMFIYIYMCIYTYVYTYS